MRHCPCRMCSLVWEAEQEARRFAKQEKLPRRERRRLREQAREAALLQLVKEMTDAC